MDRDHADFAFERFAKVLIEILQRHGVELSEMIEEIEREETEKETGRRFLKSDM